MKSRSKIIIAPICCFLAIGLVAIALSLFPFNKDDDQIDDPNQKLLYFGKDTYASSIQANEIKIDWEKYPTAQMDMSLTQDWINEDPYFMMGVPGWKTYQYDATTVLYEYPVYIAFTVNKSKDDLRDTTIDNLKKLENLTRLHEKSSDTLQIGNFEIQRSFGSCTAQTTIVELREYVSYTFSDGMLQYCFLGIATRGSETTTSHLATTIENMIQTISFNSLDGGFVEE